MGHRWQGWRPVIDVLAAEFDVIACDTPGFGASSPLPGVAPTIAANADAFQQFFAELGVERPHVAGNSMGGAIALELARRDAVRSATVFSPAGFWTPPERRFAQISLGILARMPRPLQPAVLRLARTTAGRFAIAAQLVKRPSAMPFDELVPTLADAFAAPSFRAALAAFDDYVFTGGPEFDNARITVAWGDADRLLLFGRQAPRAAKILSGARHMTLDAGHVPFFDCPDAVADAIRATAAA